MTKYINPSNLPQPYVDAVMKDDYDAGDADYTPSSLNKPPYMALLEKKHKDDIEVDVADRFFALQGKMAHKLLEIQEKGSSALAELRVYTMVKDPNSGKEWAIGMQFDRLHIDKGSNSLQDWKMTTVYKFKKDHNGALPDVAEWDRQLNIGAYILRKGGWFRDANNTKRLFKPLPVDRLEIVGLLRDFRASEAKRDPMYPQKPVVKRELKIWSDEEAEEYICDRAGAHDLAKDVGLQDTDPCTDEETWAKPTVWAIMKKGLKRAKKSGFETAEKASEFIVEKDLVKDHFVEVRPGARNRCDGYCDVAKFCPDYRRWLAENGKK